VRRVGPEAVITGLTDTTVTAARRRGKYLLCDLDSGDVMMIHLRMSGRVLVVDVGSEHPPHTHVVLRLAGGHDEKSEMLFVDPRTFGEVVVYDPHDEIEVMPELSRLGVDPIEDEFNADVLEHALRGRRGGIKSVLLNQRFVAGIGNIYADEILHRARLRWDHPAHHLSRRKLSTLATSITEVLAVAIEAGGSTLDDTQYVNIDGSVGGYQHEHRVYGRAGEQCITCGKSRIVRVAVAGRGTWYCPRCQR
jgi:formamidopyrimidine-DNA glycosylase